MWPMALVGERRLASIFVDSDPICPGQHNKWTAMLQGGYIVSHEYVMSAGSSGICVAVKHGFRTKRAIWISPGFRHHRTELADIVVKASQCSNSKVNILDGDRAQFVARLSKLTTERAPHLRRPLDALALVVPDARGGNLNCRSAMVKADFVKLMYSINVSRSTRVICRR